GRPGPAGGRPGEAEAPPAAAPAAAHADPTPATAPAPPRTDPAPTAAPTAAPTDRRAPAGGRPAPVNGQRSTTAPARRTGGPDGRPDAAPRRGEHDRPEPGPLPRKDATTAAAPAFEELYESAHTRLVQQVFLLTACRHRAAHCVQRAFGEARRQWDDVAAGPDPEGWVRARACEAALSPWHRGGPRRAHAWRLPHRRIKVRPADESQAVLPDHDRLTDRDRALLKALKRLSRPQRRALVLHDGLGLPAAAVAVEVESTLAAAEGRVWAARTALAQWVPELAGPDPAADGFADRLSALLHRAAVRGCPQPHRPAVPLLRARYGLASATRTGAAALISVAVAGAAVATLAGGGPGKLFRPGGAPAPTLCAPAADGAVPAPPDAPVTGVRSLWCSTTPGVEPVVVDPPPPGGRLWELPAAGRSADALPPPGPAACTLWSLRPCATDH
ncbi:hypothetical protein J5Y04_23810, partial [Kitasatospora sp. RG8]|uniref:sigma-70 family RNA polymerase sigma factor n=1 Tax=Kitasatospora sp. RG8 TaxID=2820815 RepID=UPI001AE0E59C